MAVNKRKTNEAAAVDGHIVYRYVGSDDVLL
jgi:hypothetical protein